MIKATKRCGRLFVLIGLVGAIMLVALPSGAQNQDLGDCIARANGTFSCEVTIPPRTVPGEYNLVAECPRPAPTGAYPPSQGNSTGPLNVSTNRVNPGQTLTASGEGCEAHSLIDFRLERIGALALAGIFGGVAEAQTGTRVMTARITVVSPASGGGVAAAAGSGAAAGGAKPAPRGALTRTGIDVLPWLGAGLAALAAGGALVLMGRKRIKKKSLPA